MMRSLADNAVAVALAWTLLNSLWQGAIAWAAYAVARRATREARLRVRWANVALVAFAVAQVATLAYCLWPVDGEIDPMLTSAAVPPSARAELIQATPIEHPKPPPPLSGFADAAEIALPWIAAGWVAVAGTLSLVTARDWLSLQRLVSRSMPADDAMLARLSALAARLPLGCDVRFALSDAVPAPATAGCFRPLVLLPTRDAAAMVPGHLDAIVLHELAHVARNDYLAALLRTAVARLYCFHPGVRSMRRQADDDAEEATDDLAAGALGDRHTLASALAELVELRIASRSALSAAGGSLTARVARLVRARPADLAGGRWHEITGAAAASTVVFAVVASALAGEAVRRHEYQWLHRHSLGEVVCATIATDRPNRTFADAMAAAVAAVRHGMGGPDRAMLDRVATSAATGVPAGEVDRIAARRLGTGAGANTPRAFDANPFGTDPERCKIIDALAAAATRAQAGNASSAQLARAAMLVSCLDSTGASGGRLFHLIRRSSTLADALPHPASAPRPHRGNHH